MHNNFTFCDRPSYQQSIKAHGPLVAGYEFLSMAYMEIPMYQTWKCDSQMLGGPSPLILPRAEIFLPRGHKIDEGFRKKMQEAKDGNCRKLWPDGQRCETKTMNRSDQMTEAVTTNGAETNWPRRQQTLLTVGDWKGLEYEWSVNSVIFPSLYATLPTHLKGLYSWTLSCVLWTHMNTGVGEK